MASSSASEVFSSPEAKGAIVGGLVGGPAGAVVGAGIANQFGDELSKLDPFKAGADAAREGQAANKAAVEEAKGLTSTVETTGSESTTGGTTSNQTSQTTFAPRSHEEQQLLDASIANFQKQQGLVSDFEGRIGARQGVQDQAQTGLGQILGGQAFNLTSDEEARINRLRQSGIDVGSNAVNSVLNERLGELQADAARRGIRGQAVSQLQTGVLGEAAKSLERTTLEANRIAAQQAIDLPGARAGVQAQTAGQFANFADVAAQQAIQNRQSLQDPVALQQLLDERLRGGTTTTSGGTTTDQTTSSTGTRVGTGEGAAGVLAATVGTPTPGAGGLATGLGAIGALGQLAGGAGQVIGAVK